MKTPNWRYSVNIPYGLSISVIFGHPQSLGLAVNITILQADIFFVIDSVLALL
jgi:hypothetical protein